MRSTAPFLVAIVLASACEVPDAKVADDTDAVADPPAVTDTGTPPPVPHTDTIRSFAMAMEIAWAATDDLMRTVCATYYNTPDCACDARYEGEGVRDLTEPLHARVLGDWRLVESVCWEVSTGLVFHDGVVWRPMDEAAAAWHTVRWADTLDTLRNWVVHGEADNDGVGPPRTGHTTFVEDARFFQRSGLHPAQRLDYDAASTTARFTPTANPTFGQQGFDDRTRTVWLFSTEETPPDASGIVVPP